MISNKRLRWLIDDYNGSGATTKCEADLSRELLDLRKKLRVLESDYEYAVSQNRLLIENSERLVYVLEAVIENHHIIGVEYEMCKQNIDKSTALMKQVKGA